MANASPRFSYLESWIETFSARVFITVPLNVITSGKAFADRSLNLPDIVMFVPPTATYPYTTSREVSINCPITNLPNGPLAVVEADAGAARGLGSMAEPN